MDARFGRPIGRPLIRMMGEKEELVLGSAMLQKHYSKNPLDVKKSFLMRSACNRLFSWLTHKPFQRKKLGEPPGA